RKTRASSRGAPRTLVLMHDAERLRKAAGTRVKRAHGGSYRSGGPPCCGQWSWRRRELEPCCHRASRQPGTGRGSSDETRAAAGRTPLAPDVSPGLAHEHGHGLDGIVGIAEAIPGGRGGLTMAGFIEGTALEGSGARRRHLPG